MKIVVWQTAFLGDLILTTPLIKSLKNLYPESQIHLISKPFGKDVFKGNPYLDELIVFDKKRDSTISLIKRLRREGYDIAISPHRSHRASYVLFLSGIKKRIGFDRAGFSFLYTDKVPHRFDGTHEIKRNLSLLKKLESYDKGKIDSLPELFLSEEEDRFFESFGLEDKKYITIAPGSKWETKRWTEEGFSELIDELVKMGESVVIIGGKEDVQVSKRIVDRLSHKSNVIDLTGSTSLRESFSVVKHSKLLISNDSAPVHIAVSFNTPVVDIYGPTVREFGFYPYRNGVVVEAEGVVCRPCGLHGHRKCPTGTFECMKKITPQKVLKAVKRFL
ncbi:MAG TPA: lipopolysaccharide heptosyltransferase II [Persephonella sp.]|uniref:lipopolysaccharide heptosyltransferase II n=1 Tax=Persephonella marina (strain DSM 14350 / EX-H1) TaxID=123214 RepID=C0QT27_PERMH|nr:MULTISPECIES: lipopolysaccharide heptosyltransferase II [Persephonella]ACO04079.1 ADP-heptose:LPS heptosyltransferase II [Persephonella marina EX-H1]HCB70539.1 lipopolysaccharide heptosyltransferase II [Persephonella sp.]